MDWAASVETATAAVFFAGDHALKIKKPLDFGFVDFRTIEARQRACEEEVRLNSRLSPDVYNGVVDLLGPEDRVIEHGVLMRRMPSDRRLSALVRSGADVRPGLDALARLIANFHSTADVVTDLDSPGGYEAIAKLWHDGAVALGAMSPDVVTARVRSAILALAENYLAGREQLFTDRLRAGNIRDGHGDLLADDIFLLEDGPRVLDCLEFDRRLRVCDVWMDVAFLVMDLERLGEPGLAGYFLDRYGEYDGPPAPASLRHFYVAYRAFVRTKVAAIRSGQGDRQAGAEARALADICLRRLRSATVTMTLVGGWPAAGKSTLASTLAGQLSAIQLSSDIVRKELHGVKPLQPRPAAFESGLYDAGATARTYAEMLRRAEIALRHGESVVLDATWRDERQRCLARDVARRANAVMTELRCTVDVATAQRRLAERVQNASDATPAVFAAIRRQFDRWPRARSIHGADAVSVARRVISENVARVERNVDFPDAALCG